MFTNEFLAVSSSCPLPNKSGDRSWDRIKKQKYYYKICGENASASGNSPWEDHAGMIVDWGTASSTGLSYGGMQDPAGHRYNIYGQNFREVGIGIFEGSKTVSYGELKLGTTCNNSQPYNLENYDQPFV